MALFEGLTQIAGTAAVAGAQGALQKLAQDTEDIQKRGMLGVTYNQAKLYFPEAAKRTREQWAVFVQQEQATLGQTIITSKNLGDINVGWIKYNLGDQGVALIKTVAEARGSDAAKTKRKSDFGLLTVDKLSQNDYFNAYGEEMVKNSNIKDPGERMKKNIVGSFQSQAYQNAMGSASDNVKSVAETIKLSLGNPTVETELQNVLNMDSNSFAMSSAVLDEMKNSPGLIEYMKQNNLTPGQLGEPQLQLIFDFDENTAQRIKEKAAANKAVFDIARVSAYHYIGLGEKDINKAQKVFQFAANLIPFVDARKGLTNLPLVGGIYVNAPEKKKKYQRELLAELGLTDATLTDQINYHNQYSKMNINVADTGLDTAGILLDKVLTGTKEGIADVAGKGMSKFDTRKEEPLQTEYTLHGEDQSYTISPKLYGKLKGQLGRVFTIAEIKAIKKSALYDDKDIVPIDDSIRRTVTIGDKKYSLSKNAYGGLVSRFGGTYETPFKAEALSYLKQKNLAAGGDLIVIKSTKKPGVKKAVVKKDTGVFGDDTLEPEIMGEGIK